MNTQNLETRKTNKEKRKKLKRTARIICHSRNEFWTTQTQFWQWVRELKVVKTGDQPLTGMFTNPQAETEIIINNTILNASHRNHLSEALSSRKYMKPRKS